MCWCFRPARDGEEIPSCLPTHTRFLQHRLVDFDHPTRPLDMLGRRMTSSESVVMSTPTTLERSLRLTRVTTTPVEDKAGSPQRVVCLTLRCTARISIAVDQLPFRSVSHLPSLSVGRGRSLLIYAPCPCSPFISEHSHHDGLPFIYHFHGRSVAFLLFSR